MSGTTLWLTILVLSAVTLATRAAILFLPARFGLPARLQRALRHAGPCILVAIVVPNLLRHDGAIDVGLHNLRLYAALAGIALFLVTRSATLMIVVGLATFTLLRLIT